MNCKYIYEAEHDGKRITGTLDEVSSALNWKSARVRRVAESKRQKRDGWAIHRIQTVQDIYTATRPDDDDIVGPSEEVAVLLGLSQDYVYMLAKKGKKTKSGWSITRETVYEEL